MIWRWLAGKLKQYLESEERDYTEYWRRTICPHGIRYDSRNRCDRCPYTGYGYGRKMDEGDRA